MNWIVFKRIIFVISALAFWMIAYSVYEWASYNTLFKQYTYIGTQLMRVDNSTDQVQVYSTSKKIWEPMP
jgi:hypothetical protein